MHRLTPCVLCFFSLLLLRSRCSVQQVVILSPANASFVSLHSAVVVHVAVSADAASAAPAATVSYLLNGVPHNRTLAETFTIELETLVIVQLIVRVCVDNACLRSAPSTFVCCLDEREVRLRALDALTEHTQEQNDLRALNSDTSFFVQDALTVENSAHVSGHAVCSYWMKWSRPSPPYHNCMNASSSPTFEYKFWSTGTAVLGLVVIDEAGAVVREAMAVVDVTHRHRQWSFYQAPLLGQPQRASSEMFLSSKPAQAFPYDSDRRLQVLVMAPSSRRFRRWEVLTAFAVNAPPHIHVRVFTDIPRSSLRVFEQAGLSVYSFLTFFDSFEHSLEQIALHMDPAAHSPQVTNVISFLSFLSFHDVAFLYDEGWHETVFRSLLYCLRHAERPRRVLYVTSVARPLGDEIDSMLVPSTAVVYSHDFQVFDLPSHVVPAPLLPQLLRTIPATWPRRTVGKFCVAFVGSMMSPSAPGAFVRVVSWIKRLRPGDVSRFAFFMIGYGNLELPIRLLARLQGVETEVHFHTLERDENAAIFLRVMDLVVDTTPTATFAILHTSAMAAGTPVVAFQTSGAQEFLHIGACLLVQETSFQAMAEAILDLSQNMTAFKWTDLERAALYAQAHYSPQLITNQMVSFVQAEAALSRQQLHGTFSKVPLGLWARNMSNTLEYVDVRRFNELWKARQHISIECRGLPPADASVLRKLQCPEQSISSPTRIMCLVFTYDRRHDNAHAVVNTWGKRCDAFVAFSNADNSSVGAVKIEFEGGESYGNMWRKVQEIWATVRFSDVFNQFDWFLICGDDTYVILEQLRAFVNSDQVLEAKRATGGRVYIGSPEHFTYNLLFNNGGAAYVLSREAVDLVVDSLETEACQHHHRTSWEDVLIALCLKRMGVLPLHTLDAQFRRRFSTKRPGDPSEQDVCPEAVTFQGFTPQEMQCVDDIVYKREGKCFVA